MPARLQKLHLGLHIADVGGGAFPDERQCIGGFHLPLMLMPQLLQFRMISTESLNPHGSISSPSHSMSAVAASLKPPPLDRLARTVSKRPSDRKAPRTGAQTAQPAPGQNPPPSGAAPRCRVQRASGASRSRSFWARRRGPSPPLPRRKGTRQLLWRQQVHPAVARGLRSSTYRSPEGG